MEIQVYNIAGKALKKIQLPDEIYNVEMNGAVLHSVVKAYQANKRQGTHATKTKAMVSGGGKKPFKQKGTGGARQGSMRNPHMPGGGEAHGPQPRDYRQYTSKRVRQLALKIALSDKARNGKLFVVDDFSIGKYSTKHVLGVLSNLKTAKALLADERKDDVLYKSTRNIHGAAALLPTELNAANVLRYENLIISETALTTLQQRFEEKKRESV
ncbi:MAG: 50S ribosomal protein L4 [Deltaproteobacteria bacterium]|nr:50S ribosomal protein L4 [Deltaproteobacteria bacterium]